MKTIDNKNGTRTVIYGEGEFQRETYKIPSLTYSKHQLLQNNVDQWIFLGQLAIDSGKVIVLDPCNIDLIDSAEVHGICLESGLADSIQINTPQGKPGLAVTFDTGLGEGLYEVMGLVKKIKGLGLRIAEAKIVFINEEASK